MQTGQKRKPAALHALKNFPGGSRPIPEEVEAVGDLESCPDWFDAERREVWEHSIAHAPKGVLKIIDRNTLAIYCHAVATHKAAVLALAEEGMVKVAPSGYEQPSPWIAIMNTQAKTILQAGAEMGFTPASRSKVSAGPVKKSNAFASNGKRD